MHNIVCTFWGRLDQGKGVDILLSILPQLTTQSQHKRVFNLFGSGPLEHQIKQVSMQYPETLIAHGRSTREQIKPVAQSGNYCLCWSEILESFGLSALEGAKLGLPIIAPYKGGLQQFIIQDLQVDTSTTLLQLLLYIDQHHDNNYPHWQQQTLSLATNYGPTNWIQEINQLTKSISADKIV